MIKNSMRRIRSRMKLRNLKTSQRMALAYGLVMALVLATAWVGVSQLQMLNARLDTVVNVNNQRAALSSTMIRSIYGTAVAIRSVALSTSKEAIAPEAQRIKNGLDQYLKAKEALQTSFTEYPVSEEEQLQFVKADGSGRSARALMEKMLEGEVDREEVTILIQNSLSRTQGLWIGELEKLVQVQSVRADATALEARAAASRAVRLLIGFGVLAAVLCLISGWLLTRSVTSGIRLAVERSQRIATGNLTPMASVERGDDFEALLQALELMRASIGTIVTSVNDTSQGITAASSEIAGGSQDLSNRTEEAAAMLQETAESAQRLTTAVRQSADSTREASDIASQTAVVAKRGGDAVGQVVSTMVAIQDSSRRIVDIIAVIDGIAFQTNILALNAAVEAARAGEQGRGFAVVASEVRALAQRSATAAKEIKGLIAASVDKVESGSRLVKDAGDTMTDIVVRVQRVTTIIGEVAGELAQQASSVGRLHDSVGDLDQITQQNAALAEQSAAAAMGLKDQARTLSETVSRFEV